MTLDQIAAVLAAERPELEIERPYCTLSDWEKGVSDEWNTTRLAFASYLAQRDPTFDRKDFERKCYA